MKQKVGEKYVHYEISSPNVYKELLDRGQKTPA